MPTDTARSSAPAPAETPGRPPFKEILPLPSILTIGAIALVTLALDLSGHRVNSIILAIAAMVALCLIKVPVTIALLSAALIGGLHAGLGMEGTLAGFNDSLLSGAQVGLTYVMVGALAVALSRSGIIEVFAQWVSKKAGADSGSVSRGVKWALYGLFILASLLSQNLIPVHIAFIPILIPPLLPVLNRLRVDRRAVAAILACSMSASYLLLPTGFGAIYLNEILLANVNEFGAAYGLTATASMAPKAMFWPVMGLVAGMAFAVLVMYRKPRDYGEPLAGSPLATRTGVEARLRPFPLVMTLLALAAALFFQIAFDSLLVGSMIGFILLTIAGIFRWNEQDDVFTRGLLMMAQIAVIITVASGFAGLLSATGEVEPLISAATAFVGGSKVLGSFLMLLMGLFITIGFGDSFASVPILAPIYIPLALELGFSPLATMCLLGAAAALGDAGSPASTISLGVSAGLGADGRHDHIRETVIPTFLHCNIGMLLFAWIAALML
ncbi:MAG: Na+/H+ antiporter NhaC family protein [Schaalia hyovaginalis]|uniref:Na+/H+ antiporter NhaC family protein n=1 Tax=Schaalia hyovaginalis TaxID=29316 RepID=UPI0023F89966|nr:Na+/H+ antiporter NhaC family protein [Schaalia hyovaginalis]MCI7672137.1 sodium:proton antiporter [Schaalia hyovaginalis]MDY5505662.1 Na+/H+ antiporter NhaC family protein [Schaalia hyovaginalis]